MDNKKNQEPTQDENRIEDLFSSPELGDELGPDELAVSAAGLTELADREVDAIISETLSQDPVDPVDMGATQIIREFHGDDGDISPEPSSQSEEESLGESSGVFIDQNYQDAFEKHGDALESGFPQMENFMDDQVDEVDISAVASLPERESESTPPTRKGRPKRKKGYGLFGIPHLLASIVWLSIAALIGVSLGRMLWLCAAEVLAFGKESSVVAITITEEDNIDSITTKLLEAGLIKSEDLFKLYADLTDAEEKIYPGTFNLNTMYDYHALVNAMSFHSSARETVDILIPEGYSCSQIFDLLEAKGVCARTELEQYAAEGELEDYWFLEGVTRGDRYCLEGYLFPDTYEFYVNDDAGRVLTKMLNGFDNRFTDIMKDKLAPLNERMANVLANRGYDEEFIKDREITIREIVIIASMIEKETANDAESHDISSVIYNRLTNPKSYPFLNIDATIVYALDGNIDPETGKTKPLTEEDLQLDHPYNTYTYRGLIPGPISNPGRNSLIAALDPNETNFYFYVFNPNTSTHMFAKSQDEHNRNVAYVKSLG